MAVKSFRDRHTEAVFDRKYTKRFGPDIARAARRKLVMVDAAIRLDDLASPPNNQLEALKRDRLGQHSIRVNDQFRICFRWHEGNAYDVELTDYH
jgi:proteic killer suppression protein